MRTSTPESLVRIIARDGQRLASQNRAHGASTLWPVLHPALRKPKPKSAMHWLSLMFVWLAVFSSCFVATEPAPVDALMLGLIVLLPVVGLVRIDVPHLGYLFLWLAICVCQLIACTLAQDVATATLHTVVSLYLCAASFVLAAFVARNPEAHTRLVMRAYIAAALVAALMGLVGYFDLVPEARQLFTMHDRATGAFKDPNVYAPFLVPPMLVLAHEIVTRRLLGIVLPAIAMAIIGLALLLSFSRGAWVNLAVGGLVYAYLAFVTARTDRQRVKLLTLCTAGLLAAVALIAAALEIDAVAKLFDLRASLDQSYDHGPEGRFGGQEKAMRLILEHPFGLGSLQFGGILHPEQPHNVYLSMALNAGWLGGLLYIVLVVLTLVLGLRSILRRQWPSRLLLAVYAAFVGLVVEGFVIDTDHWRHFYVVTGLMWGLMLEPAAVRRRMPRLRTDAASAALPLVIPPALGLPARLALDRAVAQARTPRRAPRIRGRAIQLQLVAAARPARRRRREPRRPPRIVSSH